jgi:hypothetical protein
MRAKGATKRDKSAAPALKRSKCSTAPAPGSKRSRKAEAAQEPGTTTKRSRKGDSTHKKLLDYDENAEYAAPTYASQLQRLQQAETLHRDGRCKTESCLLH